MNKASHTQSKDLPQFPPAALNEIEAARYVGMSVHYLRQSRFHENTDAPPFVKIGRSVRYLKADLDSWLAERRVVFGGRHA